MLRQSRATGHASWSEPYQDTGGGDIPMVTFSAPIKSGGRFVGVQTLDLWAELFQVLGGWLKELHLGGRDVRDCASQKGVFTSHPDPDFDFAQTGGLGKAAPADRRSGNRRPSVRAADRSHAAQRVGGAVPPSIHDGQARYVSCRARAVRWVDLRGGRGPANRRRHTLVRLQRSPLDSGQSDVEWGCEVPVVRAAPVSGGAAGSGEGAAFC